MIILVLLTFVVACICSVKFITEAIVADPKKGKSKFEFTLLELALFNLSLNVAVGLGIHLAYIGSHYFSR